MGNSLAESRNPSAYATKIKRPEPPVRTPTPTIQPEVVDQPSDDAFKEAVGAFAKAVYQEDGQLLKAFLDGNAAKMPGSSWSNQGTINNSLIARVTQNLASSFNRAPEELEAALAEHGLSWGPPFPPGRPLDPFWGYRRPPRTRDFSVGENTQLTPRWNRISFPTLKGIIESYYAAQICVRHLINDVRSLDYQIIPPQNVLEDATEDIAKAEDFLASPDKRQPFRAWLGEYLQDVLRYDAGSLYIRRNGAGDPIALEVVSGTTIIPLSDFFGRPPMDENDVNATPESIWEGDVVPAFVQIIEGMPWVWLTAEDLLYQPLNPLPESNYGLAPMEAVLLQANTDIRFQWHFLQYFTEGSIPQGFMEAPPDLSDPSQVEEWQETWDAVMLGDQSKLRQIRWVPAGAKFTAVKPGEFDKEFPLYLMRCVSAAFGVTPNDLGFTEDVNRSTGEIQVDVQFRIGTLPIVRHVEDVINLFLREHLKLRARIAFDTGQGTQHRLETAQADDIDIKNGTMSSDERRVRLGMRISKERPTARYIDNTRAGPIPLLALESMAGEIDPTTYGPTKGQKNIDMPFISAPGVAPVIGSDDFKAAQDSTANAQRNMLIQSNNANSTGRAKGADRVHTGSQPDALAQRTAAPPPKPAPAKKAVRTCDSPEEAEILLKYVFGDEYAVVGSSIVVKEGMIGAPDNTGGPGVTRGFSGPTEGITAETGAQGVDLDDEEEDPVEKAFRCLKKWRENSLNRVKKGQVPRRFEDLPPFVSGPIWNRLETAKTREEVIAAFSGDMLCPKVEARKGLNRVAAGIAVQAEDTGRVLMIKRTPDKHDDDDTNARWEWPGGKLDGGDGTEDPSVWAGALREWAEETGGTMPEGAEPCGGWVSDDEEYEGFVVRVPHEADIALDPQPEEASAAAWWDPDDLEDDDVREKVHEDLGDLKPILKAKWEDFHRNTDKIVDHYTPLIRDSMASVLGGDTARHAIHVAYGVEKALPNSPGTPNTPKYNAAIEALIGSPQIAGGVAGVGAVGAAQIGAALSLLGVAPAAAVALSALLRSLWTNAYLEGQTEAVAASTGLSRGEEWQPPDEVMEQAAAQTNPDLFKLLQKVDVTLNGIVETEVNRVGETIRQAVLDGTPIDQTIAAVDEIVQDADRAKLIAETEFARASTLARRQTYLRNNVAMVQWLHQPGACPRCMENADVSPIPITQAWPSGNVPVHPHCRCVEAPYIRVPGRPT